jgi:hypothetical protein
MLKAIGFWIEGIDDELNPASPELVGVMPSEQLARLADYLAAGMTHTRFLGYDSCQFLCGCGRSGEPL